MCTPPHPARWAGGRWPSSPEGDRVAALRIAAEHGHLAVIDQLIAAGTPVDGLDRDDSTALHEAAYSGQVDAVRHLTCPRRGPGPPRHALRRDPARLVPAPAWRGRGQRRPRGDRTPSRPGHPVVRPPRPRRSPPARPAVTAGIASTPQAACTPIRYPRAGLRRTTAATDLLHRSRRGALRRVRLPRHRPTRVGAAVHSSWGRCGAGFGRP